MTTFTLLHGAWHGAWCWDQVAAILRGRGHRVTVPVMPGLGERAAELRAGITLGRFVDALVDHLVTEDVRDGVLVGHSFGGNVITGAAARLRKSGEDGVGRIAELVFLDAMVPLSGIPPCETVPREVWARRRAGAIMVGGVPCLSPPKADALGIFDPEQAAFIEERMVPHPIETYETAIDFDGAPDQGFTARYIMVTNPVYPPLADHRARAQALGWRFQEIATGHDAMIGAPEALADLLAGER